MGAYSHIICTISLHGAHSFCLFLPASLCPKINYLTPQNMAAAMNGKWKLASQENFDEYLSKVGVGLMKRKMACSMSPTCDVDIQGDTINIKNSLGKDVVFTIGVEFGHESPTGEKFKVTGYWEGDKLCTKASVKGGDHITYREVVGDELINTIVFGDLTCKRIFKKC